MSQNSVLELCDCGIAVLNSIFTIQRFGHKGFESSFDSGKLLRRAIGILLHAAEYSNIGINKLEILLRSPRCAFVPYVGKKKLVKKSLKSS